MVVPLHDDRHLGIEGAQMLVEEIVFVGGAEFVERLGDLCLFRDGDVLPDLAVGQRHLGLDRAVGIDVSPECRKKSGRCLRMVAKVNMPPSSGLMPQPCPATSPPQTKLTSRRSAGAVRKRPMTGSLRISGVGEIAEFDAIEDVLPRGEVFQQHLCGEVALGQCRDRRQGADAAQRIRWSKPRPSSARAGRRAPTPRRHRRRRRRIARRR